ncbi:hypothetical protein PYCC9005_002563 [Savitreella phatthalungensis]
METHANALNPLSQIPLVRSPYLRIPPAVTLPYNYTSARASLTDPSMDDGTDLARLVPRTLPRSIAIADRPAGGASVDLMSAEEGVEEVVMKVVTDEREAIERAGALVGAWKKEIGDRELARKRRIAPGFLDTGVTMLVPQPSGSSDQNTHKHSGNEVPTNAKPSELLSGLHF